DDMLRVLAHESLQALVRRGMATPEHILRAGRLPLWLELDPSAPPDQLAEAVRSQISRQRVEYEEYHRRHAEGGERPLDDWAKVVLAPGVGMITAFRDKRGAVTANLCYRAVLETITNAEAIGGFQFIPEAEVFAFEHWPLERRKIEEQDAHERASLLVPRHVALVIGGGSGIGRAAARRFAQAGAHVVVADRDAAAADVVATEIGAAAAVMRRQRSGGSIVASVSKAALAPGRDAVAYGGSKAALLQALRVAAVELGGDGIRVNAINADQVDTPLFRQFAAQRAASPDISVR